MIEVADSSLRFGRTVKLEAYARAGIAEYWIVDLKRKTLKAHRKPHQGVYAQTNAHRPEGRLALAAMPELVVDLRVALG